MVQGTIVSRRAIVQHDAGRSPPLPEKVAHMPELPEVETVRRGLEPAMVGRTFVRVEQRRADLRFPFPQHFSDRLTGTTVTDISRRGKLMMAGLDSGEVLLMHLGMSGGFAILDNAPETPGRFYHRRDNQPDQAGRHDHVVFEMSGGATVIYNDPRRFGFMGLERSDELTASRHLRNLGPEPLGAEFTGQYLATALAGRQTSLKAALLDQRLVAGLGNIYVSEALHHARLSPRRLAASASARNGRSIRAERLVVAVREVLAAAIEAGGSSLKDFAHTDGGLGLFQHRFAVYDRAGTQCPRTRCGGTIKKIVQNGRSTFYCPACQR